MAKMGITTDLALFFSRSLIFSTHIELWNIGPAETYGLTSSPNFVIKTIDIVYENYALNMLWSNGHSSDPFFKFVASEHFWYFKSMAIWLDCGDSKCSLLYVWLPLIPTRKIFRGMIKDKSRDRWKTFNHRLLDSIVVLCLMANLVAQLFYPFVAIVWFQFSFAQFPPSFPLPRSSLSMTVCFVKSSQFNAQKSIKNEFTHNQKRTASTNHWTVDEVPLPQNNWLQAQQPLIYWSDQFFLDDHNLRSTENVLMLLYIN